MKISNTEAVLLLDTRDEIWGFSLVNGDGTNAVYISTDQAALNATLGQAAGGIPGSGKGIPIGANGGSWTVMHFNGKLYAIAIAAPVELRFEPWWTGFTIGKRSAL
jgi:hypothetical protein